MDTRTPAAPHAAVSESPAPPAAEWTVADLARRFGSLPAYRVRTCPPPGTATEQDLERVRCSTGILCELIDGTLVEKGVSDFSSGVGGLLAYFLVQHVLPRRLGWVHPADGFVWVNGVQLRAPDVSFTRRDQRPGGRLLRRGYARVAPVLAAEVLSPSNTAEEMDRKRAEFFSAGTELFWIVDPIARTVAVYTRPEAPDAILGESDTLTGGTVLPEFAVSVRELLDAAEVPDDEMPDDEMPDDEMPDDEMPDDGMSRASGPEHADDQIVDGVGADGDAEAAGHE